MIKQYTHPHCSPEHVANVYRAYIVGQKRVWMEQGKGNRCMRGVIHYSEIVQEYLAARELTIVKLKEMGKWPRVRIKKQNSNEYGLTVFLWSWYSGQDYTLNLPNRRISWLRKR